MIRNPIRIATIPENPIRCIALTKDAPVIRLRGGSSSVTTLQVEIIAETAATRQRADPLILIDALLNPGL
jgi:hypothetical protein